MAKDIVFEQLNDDEMKLVLRAYDYDVDCEGFILSPSGCRIPSEEVPSEFLRATNVALIPGSLRPIDGSPTSISKFIREEVEDCDDDRA
jgi:hypothetical protein